jgi:hypothetical protein
LRRRRRLAVHDAVHVDLADEDPPTNPNRREHASFDVGVEGTLGDACTLAASETLMHREFIAA